MKARRAVLTVGLGCLVGLLLASTAGANLSFPQSVTFEQVIGQSTVIAVVTQSEEPAKVELIPIDPKAARRFPPFKRIRTAYRVVEKLRGPSTLVPGTTIFVDGADWQRNLSEMRARLLRKINRSIYVTSFYGDVAEGEKTFIVFLRVSGKDELAFTFRRAMVALSRKQEVLEAMARPTRVEVRVRVGPAKSSPRSP